MKWWNTPAVAMWAWHEHNAHYVMWIHECPVCHVIHENRTQTRELCKEHRHD